MYYWHILPWRPGDSMTANPSGGSYALLPDCANMQGIANFLLATYTLPAALHSSGNFAFHCLPWLGSSNPIWENKANKNDNSEMASTYMYIYS